MSGEIRYDYEKHHAHKSEFAWLGWKLSVAFGIIGLIFLAFALLLVGMEVNSTIRQVVLALVPRAVEIWFEAPEGPSPKTKSGVLPKEIQELLKQLPASPRQGELTPKARPAASSRGATKLEVLQVQGVPDRVEGETWYYGQSQVYFSQDRVSGWRNSSQNPLRVR